MLKNDLGDELLKAQNCFCDRILCDESTEKWFDANELKKLVLYGNLRNLLRKELLNFKVSRGFALCVDKLSSKIDLIIYQGNEIYQNNEFVIVEASQIKAIIALVGTFKINQFQALINRLCKLKASINNAIFAGICAYHFEQELVQRREFRDFFAEIKGKFERKMQRRFKPSHFIECISFSKDWFMRYFGEIYDYPCYEAFNLDDYSYDYLVLNLKVHLGLSDEREFDRHGISGGKMSADRMQIMLGSDENSRMMR